MLPGCAGRCSVEPYFLFLFCGILPWTWFNSSIAARGLGGADLRRRNLIKKVLFPAEVLPTVTVFANFMHFLLGLPILFGFLIWRGTARSAGQRPSAPGAAAWSRWC